MQKYDYSPQKALRATYSEFDWKASEFAKVPRGFWFDAENQRSFVEFLGK